MTVIVALFDNSQLWLGSNSQGTVGATRLPGHESKWRFYGDWAIAFTGSGFPSEALAAKATDFPGKAEDHQQVTAYIRDVFEHFDIGEQKKMKNFDAQGLIVHRGGRIFDMDQYTSMSEVPKGTMWARGCGMDYALGADEVSKALSQTPEDRIRRAVEASIALDCDCPGHPIVEKF